MRRSIFCAILATYVLGTAAFCHTGAQVPHEFTIAGYVFPNNSLLTHDQIDARNLTRINYAFAAIQDGRMVAGSTFDAQNLALLTSLRKQNPSLKVLISVGGWLWSSGFSDISLTAQSRKTFVDSVMDFLRRCDLDGLDVDWEYPGMPGAGHPFRPEDKRNFTLLLKDLRGRFDQEQKATGRRLVLTIAAGASDDYLAHTEMNEVRRYVDTVNLMTYDYALPSVDSITTHSTPLFANPAAPRQESADASVRAFERAGVPSGRILLGVAFYGHLWGQVADRNHGLFQPGKPAPGDFAPFSAIQQNMLGHGFTRYWDKAAAVPYLYNEETQEFVSYDDAESLAIKCTYVKMHQLGGTMFWQYLDDPSSALVETMSRVLRQASKGAQ
ncbi:MAG: glycoside hydrolase family 18 protein [Terracidiphilus sp.]|jgi:chitinase